MVKESRWCGAADPPPWPASGKAHRHARPDDARKSATDLQTGSRSDVFYISQMMCPVDGVPQLTLIMLTIDCPRHREVRG